MITVQFLNLAAHIAAGTAGLLAGLLPLMSAKGGQRHRRWGRVFVAFAAPVMATAALSVWLGHNRGALLAALTLSASYQLVGGLRALRHQRLDAWDGTLAIAALALAAWLWADPASRSGHLPPYLARSALGFVMLLALYDLSRFGWQDAWRRSVRPFDHGLKMTGVFFAMLSAGAGNALPMLQPWSILVPNLLGVAVMLVFAIQAGRQGNQMSKRVSLPLAASR
ncbi:MAG: hypothetical protein V4508_22590 [Pseudomonadota bacterium]